jgi:hypothetical protein
MPEIRDVRLANFSNPTAPILGASNAVQGTAPMRFESEAGTARFKAVPVTPSPVQSRTPSVLGQKPSQASFDPGFAPRVNESVLDGLNSAPLPRIPEGEQPPGQLITKLVPRTLFTQAALAGAAKPLIRDPLTGSLRDRDSGKSDFGPTKANKRDLFLTDGLPPNSKGVNTRSNAPLVGGGSSSIAAAPRLRKLSEKKELFLSQNIEQRKSQDLPPGFPFSAGPGLLAGLGAAKVRPFIGLTSEQSLDRAGAYFAGESFLKIYEQYFTDLNISPNKTGVLRLPPEVIQLAADLGPSYVDSVRTISDQFRPENQADLYTEELARFAYTDRQDIELRRINALTVAGKGSTIRSGQPALVPFSAFVSQAIEKLVEQGRIVSDLSFNGFNGQAVLERSSLIFEEVIDELSKPEPALDSFVKAVKLAEPLLKIVKPIGLALSVANLGQTVLRLKNSFDLGRKTGDFSQTRIEVAKAIGDLAGGVGGAVTGAALSSLFSLGPVGLVVTIFVLSTLGGVGASALAEQAAAR